MKILIDTNIILDLILEREPFVEDAIALLIHFLEYADTSWKCLQQL